MEKYAKLSNNKVQNTVYADKVDATAKIVAIEPSLEKYVDSKYTFDPLTKKFKAPDLEYVKAQAKEILKTLRKQKEEGGLTLPNGIKIATAVVDQNRITAALTMLSSNPNPESVTIPFKAENGFVDLSILDLQNIAKAIMGHVQSCFEKEKNITAVIDSKTLESEIYSLDLETLWNA